MKKIWLTLAIAGSLAAAVSYAADPTIGVVDYLSVFKQVPQGQATLDQLKAKFAPQETQLKTTQTNLLAALNTFQKNAPTLSAKDKNAQAAKLTSEQQSFQQSVANLRDQETQAQQTAADAFQAALTSAITQVGKAGHYDLILTDQAAPFYQDSYDVTDQVVSIMNKSNS